MLEPVQNLMDFAPDGRPRICAKGMELGTMTKRALDALVQWNDPPTVFVRGGKPSRVRKDERGQAFVEILTVPQTRSILAEAAAWYAPQKAGPVDCFPPRDVAESVVGLESWPGIPALRGITDTPILHDDGSLHAETGYDTVTEFYYHPREPLSIELPDTVTQNDVAASLAVLDDVFAEFPFIDDASRTDFYATLLTIVLRNLIDGLTPAALLDKTSPGTGASLLCDVISTIATGEPAQMITYPSKEEEMDKLLASLLVEGRSLICFDNIDRPIESAALSSLLTSRVSKKRRLGKTEALSLPNHATIVLNGNNLAPRGDICRRLLWSRLNAKLARPWEGRTFRYPDLLHYVSAHRAEILRAVYVLAKGWLQAGRPKLEDRLLGVLGGFAIWRDIVGGILHHAGAAGFLANSGELYEQINEEAAEWEDFLLKLLVTFTSGDPDRSLSFTVASLNEAIQSSRAHTDALVDLLPGDLADHFGAPGFTRKLGKALLRKRETRHGSNGLRVERVPGKCRVASWRVLTDETKAKP